MNRRALLAALGLGSSSLFLPSLAGRGEAQAMSPPRRVVFFFTQHGTWYDGWKIHPSGLSPNDRWELDLTRLAPDAMSPALAPLHDYARELLIVDGTALVSADDDPGGMRHELGQIHALTGANTAMVSGIPLATAPSLDQRIADHVARADRYRSLELGVGAPPFPINYSNAFAPLPFETSPATLHQRLFARAGLGAGASGPGSVLDALAQRYTALGARLSTEDRAVLDAHRDQLRALELRMAGLAAAQCDAPPEPPESAEPAASAARYEADFSSFVALTTSALACDLTRVVTLHMGDVPTESFVPGFVGDVHADFAHDVYVSQAASDAMTAYSAHHATQFRRLLAALSAVPEGSGTLLDSTLCVWVGELADGAHGYERWPVVLAGGRALGLGLGRVLHFPSSTPYAGWSFRGRLERMGVPHQQLLIGIGQALGLTLDALPVREIAGISGARIDCTGALPGLLG